MTPVEADLELLRLRIDRVEQRWNYKVDAMGAVVLGTLMLWLALDAPALVRRWIWLAQPELRFAIAGAFALTCVTLPLAMVERRRRREYQARRQQIFLSISPKLPKS